MWEGCTHTHDFICFLKSSKRQFRSYWMNMGAIIFLCDTKFRFCDPLIFLQLYFLDNMHLNQEYNDRVAFSPVIHWNWPSSRRIVKASPGFTCTRITCGKTKRRSIWQYKFIPSEERERERQRDRDRETERQRDRKRMWQLEQKQLPHNFSKTW